LQNVREEVEDKMKKFEKIMKYIWYIFVKVCIMISIAISGAYLILQLSLYLIKSGANEWISSIIVYAMALSLIYGMVVFTFKFNQSSMYWGKESK
jgi:hypothetical protein